MGSCSSTRVVVLLMILVVAFSAATMYSTVMYDHKAIVINGQRRIMFSGSIHYPRSTPEMWPDLIQMRVLGFFGNLCPGSDLTHFQLPPLFNMPKSQLQCYREGLYCINKDMIRRCARGKSSLKRWSIIAAQLPGRTDNDIKNYWNTKLKKKLLGKQKNQGTNSSSNPEVLSSTAMERMQLHMHLQDRHGPFTFYNSPLLWPRLPQQCQHNAAIALTGSGSLAIPVDRGEAEEADANLVTGLPPYFENLNENYISSGCATSQEDMNVLDQEVNGVGNYAENVFWWETSGLDENCVIGFGI